MKHLLITLTCLLLALPAMAKNDVKRPDSYNYNRAVEAIQNGNYDEATGFLNKELQDNPKNGYAYYWLAAIKVNGQEYAPALTYADKALKLLPGKDKEFVANAYSVRANIYLGLDQPDKALADFTRAIKANPTDPELYSERGGLLYNQEKYRQSDLDYSLMVNLDPGQIMGYMGLGRNATAQGRYDDAIENFTYAIKLSPENSLPYSFRAEALANQGKYDEAADDVMRALAIDRNDKAFNIMQVLADTIAPTLTTKLKVQANANPSDNYWPYCLGLVAESQGHYNEALQNYLKGYNLTPNDVLANRIANYYALFDDYASAIKWMDKAIEGDPNYPPYLVIKAGYLGNNGNYAESIATLNDYITKAPTDPNGYYRRGLAKKYSGDVKGAIDDISMEISLNPDYIYAYLVRGTLYKQNGQDDLAKSDFEHVVAFDTVPGEDNAAQTAYFYLGKNDKAIDFMNRSLEKIDNNYDAACLYSLMGQKDKALDYFEKALQGGFSEFALIGHDEDLNNIRSTARFKQLLSKYEKEFRDAIASDDDDPSQYKTVVAEVPFKREGGVCKVKCKINGLPLHFVFDTGASDVSMSSVEATFMLKNDYLTNSDIIGKQNYMTANGEISQGTVVNLREVEFGGLKLNNVQASVASSQSAPLLLGQSVLGRLGKIEIDNEKQVIRITSKVKKQSATAKK